MIAWTTVLPLAAALVLAPVKGAPMTERHATGTFEVTLTPEATNGAANGGLPLARTALAKTFGGGMVGRATGLMLSVAADDGLPAAYVAIDQFRGRVDGREGGFALLHRGTIDRAGGSALSVTIAPDSGTGALAGIAGTLSIRIEGRVHHYDLAYTLPAGDGAGR